ncbi:MAG: hypothetical protein ABUS54_05655 [Actinomycetota bacterium]
MLAAVAAAAALTCARTPQSRTHDQAVFGHFATRAAANRLAGKARAVKFQNVNVEDEGCGDWKVYVGGADTQQQRTSFAQEARVAGFAITFQQRGEPLQPPNGQVYGVFAAKRSIGEANALSWKLALLGFNYTEIVPVGSRWDVVMPQVPVKNALSIAKEVARAGYHIQFHQP